MGPISSLAMSGEKEIRLTGIEQRLPSAFPVTLFLQLCRVMQVKLVVMVVVAVKGKGIIVPLLY